VRGTTVKATSKQILFLVYPAGKIAEKAVCNGTVFWVPN